MDPGDLPQWIVKAKEEETWSSEFGGEGKGKERRSGLTKERPSGLIGSRA